MISQEDLRDPSLPQRERNERGVGREHKGSYCPFADIQHRCDIPSMLTFLLGLLATSSALPAVQRITPEEAAKRVSQCGLGPVTTRYDSDLQEEILIAGSAQSATDEQLACAYKVVGFYYTLDLPPNVQRRFDEILGAAADARARAEAREWLSARGLLNRVPEYQTGVTDDSAFTRQVEALCGPQAKGAFQSKHGFHALSPDWAKQLGLPPKREGMEAFSCLMNATAYAGFTFGFIGNEAIKRPQ